jgi:hypothetical protein
MTVEEEGGTGGGWGGALSLIRIGCCCCRRCCCCCCCCARAGLFFFWGRPRRPALLALPLPLLSHRNTTQPNQPQNTQPQNKKQPHYVPVCAYLEWNLDGLVEMIWDYLDLQRVYTKPKGRLPDFGDPVVLRRDKATVEDFANRIHKALIKRMKYALVWGTSAKHRPQRVGKEHVLQDEDIVSLVLR